MNREDTLLLFAYNRWANAQVLDALSQLTEEQLKRNLSSSHGSVHGTLTHILAAEWVWLMRCKGVSPAALFDPADFSLDSLSAELAEVEREQKRFIDELAEQSLSTVVSYTNTKGEQWAYPLNQILQHVANHSTYHRGQVITMLRQLGADAVMTDFLVYIDSKPKQYGRTSSPASRIENDPSTRRSETTPRRSLIVMPSSIIS
jgi:uncharacterized damage-inducible protein DinB